MFKNMTPDQQEEELEKCKKGRKVQILIQLEKNQRVTSAHLSELTGIRNSNLATYTNRLVDNGLISVYQEDAFKDPSEANYKYYYHSLTPKGALLISDLDKVSRRQE